MNNKILLLVALSAFCVSGSAQKVKFTEFDLDNGLHVILHRDNTNPVVAVSVMYHVGSKDESPDRTGFAHFFEHLLFEGSKNIARGDISGRSIKLTAFSAIGVPRRAGAY